MLRKRGQILGGGLGAPFREKIKCAQASALKVTPHQDPFSHVNN